ncbi:amidohydrolase family protein [Hydrogenophaga sp.]|uniref:amidohydrolase family protein n=1 Tax=Hydrogenophaga sp. TaxID=1904254 RepID=UPI00271D20D7|nr:amidohydrolase family protein [Hydrogenophaga sp.]MDO9437637.1 amidohydrolase family protein [Hydrogenophaga sp.]
MRPTPDHPVIAIEEHYWDDELASHFTGAEASRAGPIEKRLRDFGGERLRDMDAAGIDICVLSHGAPSSQKIPADIAVPLVRRVNDRLAAAVAANPTRLAAFAALPTADPQAAADELERCVAMGFKGAMVHGSTNGEFIDLPKYWPIFARAEQLDVPIYLHPAQPHPAVMDAYYKDYLGDFPMLARPAWGYAVECGTQVVRLVLSGVFERHPNLKIVLGHLGESVPFQLWRLDQALSRPGQKSVRFREIFTRNFWITTSGFFSTPALLCCAMEMGVDRILFSVDWPFVADSSAGTRWMKDVPLCADDKNRILSGNARRLLRM